MQTKIHATLIDDPAVQTADGILRSCVHCGFCTAVCPTYQLLGDELDGPRGRIYLIKELLEHNEIASSAVTHIDRCLTCRACETACPSGVAYGQLLDIGRGMIAQLVRRRWRERIIAWSLLLVVPRPKLFGMFLRMGQMLRPLLPEAFKKTIPVKTAPRRYPMSHARNPVRRVLVLEGCVQRSATPDVNQALAYLLDLHQIEVTRLVAEGCCGALEYHLGAHKAGKARMRSLLDSLSTRLEEVDAVVSSASGCGVTIKDYPKVFENEPEYQQLARSVVAKTVDAAELLS
ncbi:MAG: glycolate oxidase subunit GlcF, partial [Pseudomonadales bacterium]